MSAATPIRQVIKRDGNSVAYDRERVATAIFKAFASQGPADRARADGLAARVEAALRSAYGVDGIPTVEDIQDVVERTLMEDGHAAVARAYIIYRHDRAQRRAARSGSVEATDNIPYRTIYEVLRWNMDHGCETVDGLNRIVAEGRFPDLVRDGEARYDAEVRAGADRIVERRPDVRLAIIAGPSSSGKTTTTIKLSERLREAGLELVALNVDHYFFDLELHPKDEFGDYDYETPHALDLPLINRHLIELLDGREVRTPHYDFKTGFRTLDVHPMRLAPNQILLIDSLHGLYEAMTASIPVSRKFKVYVETLGQLRAADGTFMRWADHRLMRRMIRDAWHRNHQPLQTLTHWHYVRSSELKNIIPFIGAVDYLVNSALPHELPVLKPRVFRFFPEAMDLYRGDPKRQDAYIRARRVRELLEPLTAVEDESAIPEGSLIREFIGGSRYAY
jgi:uridine kinase